MKLTVRFTKDHDKGKMWFEERLANGQWVQIPETVCACEGNARYSLKEVIEKRRQQALSISRSHGEEEEYEI